MLFYQVTVPVRGPINRAYTTENTNGKLCFNLLAKSRHQYRNLLLSRCNTHDETSLYLPACDLTALFGLARYLLLLATPLNNNLLSATYHAFQTRQ